MRSLHLYVSRMRGLRDISHDALIPLCVTWAKSVRQQTVLSRSRCIYTKILLPNFNNLLVMLLWLKVWKTIHPLTSNVCFIYDLHSRRGAPPPHIFEYIDVISDLQILTSQLTLASQEAFEPQPVSYKVDERIHVCADPTWQTPWPNVSNGRLIIFMLQFKSPPILNGRYDNPKIFK